MAAAAPSITAAGSATGPSFPHRARASVANWLSAVRCSHCIRLTHHYNKPVVAKTRAGTTDVAVVINRPRPLCCVSKTKYFEPSRLYLQQLRRLIFILLLVVASWYSVVIIRSPRFSLRAQAEGAPVVRVDATTFYVVMGSF